MAVASVDSSFAAGCSFSSASALQDVMEMPQEMAQQLFRSGAFVIFLDFPSGCEFGIDYKSWTVGPKFRGLKMIPPGVHFIYYCCKSVPRMGFFHCFTEGEVLVRRWNRVKEDIELVAQDEIDRLSSDLRAQDPHLGPYPYETYRSWFALSNHITSVTVERLRPENEMGRVSAQAELVTMEAEVASASGGSTCGSSQVDREHPTRLRFVDHQGLPIMRIRPGYEIRFSEIPPVEVCETTTTRERTRVGMDASGQMDKLINTRMNGDAMQLLAEIQFAFVCFLVGQVYEGFEQWKHLIRLVSACSTALVDRPEFFIALLPVLHYQLRECPEDFFVDIVSKDNFLTETLSNLFANIQETENVDSQLKEKWGKFRAYLTKRFRWNFECGD